MPNQQVACIEKLYTAFNAKDVDSMIACYHPDLTFEDPVFGELNYEQTCAMWRMLVGSATDLEISYKNAWSENVFGGVDWEAVYTFSRTGRKVCNVIDAKFKFKDGLIIGHRDHFSFYRWARMAFGKSGAFLGWTPYFKKKVMKTAQSNLTRSMQQK